MAGGLKSFDGRGGDGMAEAALPLMCENDEYFHGSPMVRDQFTTGNLPAIAGM